MADYRNNPSDRDDDFESPVMATKYAHTASILVSTLAKNFVFIIGVISALTVIAVLDVLHVVGYMKAIPDVVFDSMIVTFSVILLIVILYLLNTLLNSKKLFSSWADTFERNSIKTGMNISMINKSKEEAISAVAETVAQIGEPLRNYISLKENVKNFLDVNIKNNNDDIFFDVLIDQDHIKNDLSDASTDNSINLKRSLLEYGAVVISVIEGTVDNEDVRSFYNSLSKYVSITKNKVGLALIIGDSISEDAGNIARQLENNKINYIVLIEKPLTMTQ
ncbi:MAG: hypothetical protein WAL24_01830 [Nitrososphaeraceae archaeon]